MSDLTAPYTYEPDNFADKDSFVKPAPPLNEEDLNSEKLDLEFDGNIANSQQKVQSDLTDDDLHPESTWEGMKNSVKLGFNEARTENLAVGQALELHQDPDRKNFFSNTPDNITEYNTPAPESLIKSLESQNKGLKLGNSPTIYDAKMLTQLYQNKKSIEEKLSLSPDTPVSELAEGASEIFGSLPSASNVVASVAGGPIAKEGVAAAQFVGKYAMKHVFKDWGAEAITDISKKVADMGMTPGGRFALKAGKNIATSAGMGSVYGFSSGIASAALNKTIYDDYKKSYGIGTALKTVWDDTFSGLVLGAAGSAVHVGARAISDKVRFPDQNADAVRYVASQLDKFDDSTINRINKYHISNSKFTDSESSAIKDNFSVWSNDTDKAIAMSSLWNGVNSTNPYVAHIMKQGKAFAAQTYRGMLSTNKVNLGVVNAKFNNALYSIGQSMIKLTEDKPELPKRNLPLNFLYFISHAEKAIDKSPQEIADSTGHLGGDFSAANSAIKDALPEEMVNSDEAYQSHINEVFSRPEKVIDEQSEKSLYDRVKNGDVPENEVPESVRKNTEIDRRVTKLKYAIKVAKKNKRLKGKAKSDAIDAITSRIKAEDEKRPELKTGTQEALGLVDKIKSKMKSTMSKYNDVKRFLSNVKAEDLSNPAVARAVRQIEDDLQDEKINDPIDLGKNKDFKRLKELGETNPQAKLLAAHLLTSTLDGQHYLFDQTRKNALVTGFRDAVKVRTALDHGEFKSPHITRADMTGYVQHMNDEVPENLEGEDKEEVNQEQETGESQDVPDDDISQEEQKQIQDKEEKAAIARMKSIGAKDILEENADLDSEIKQMPIFKNMAKSLITCLLGSVDE